MKAEAWFSTVVVIAVLAAACRSAPTQGSAATSTASSRSAAAAPQEPGRAAEVVEVVFIGQRNACECTRNRIDTSWAALEQVLAKHPGIKIKKVEQDVDQDEADRYDQLKALMVAPGVYLMDGNGKLIQMLQGELTVTQLEQAIAGSPVVPTG
ncbi:MAG: hypothetical protein JRI23_19175 [Deltaproteobacteria bacterium]|nr:hypothetical protein [Deltaproteobacteria bacterium]MBW2533988.1 hypothetical protein [Deltaproteobacteria bacterium]